MLRVPVTSEAKQYTTQRVMEESKLDRSHSADLLGSREKPYVAYCSTEALDTNCTTKQAKDGGNHAAFALGIGRQAENSQGSRLRLGSSSVLTDHLIFGKRLMVAAEHEDPREMTDTDSRPSSGFYENSEMDSCSLSTSCTSVYSEGPPESCWSMDSLCHLPAFCKGKSTRPHSTDEAAIRLMDLRLQRLMAATHPTGNKHLDSPRPVSTGDLELIPTLQTLGDFPASGLRALSYTCDLVSCNTSEVYHYPSPLHAVALQSPLFISSPSHEDLSKAVASPTAANEQRQATSLPCSEELRRRLDRYIAKLVLQHRCRLAACGLAQSRSELGSLSGHQKSLSMSSVYSSPIASAQLTHSGSKIRRRISTCSHVRSAEGTGGSRDSQLSRDSFISLDGTDGFLVEQRHEHCPVSREKQAERAPVLEEVAELGSPEPTHRLVLVPQRMPQVMDSLYKGRHTSRELVKTTAPVHERSWLSPREVFRRLSLRKKSSNSRCTSEMNVSVMATSYPRTDALCRCGSRLSLTTNGWKVYTRHQWTSVLEIPASRNPDSPSQLNAELCNSPALWAFSTDCCAVIGQAVPHPTKEGRYHFCSNASLSEPNASSNTRLNGDWSQHLRGGAPCQVSTSSDVAVPPGNNCKLHRTRSFRELKRKVCRSMNPFHPRGSSR
ncbi:uncharacterized protein [Ambystoma mexicanum]|uniref:uncharacterized protein isoform X2 n=1 Tax=Ambystoma mexicanum TaxID=8296 RepID=UPI0037E84CF2